MNDLIQEARERAIRKALDDSDLRIFLWDLICRKCEVFSSGYPHNAAAYRLLARQQIGKELLAELKDMDMEQVFRAESEYEQMFRRMKAELELQQQKYENETIGRMLNGN